MTFLLYCTSYIKHNSTCVQIVTYTLASDSVLPESTGLIYPALSVSVNEICFYKEAANQIVSFNSCFSVVGWGGVVIRVTWKLVEFFSYFYRLLPRCVSLPSIPHRGGRCPKQASRQVYRHLGTMTQLARYNIDRTSYRKISQSLECVGSVFCVF